MKKIILCFHIFIICQILFYYLNINVKENTIHVQRSCKIWIIWTSFTYKFSIPCRSFEVYLCFFLWYPIKNYILLYQYNGAFDFWRLTQAVQFTVLKLRRQFLYFRNYKVLFIFISSWDVWATERYFFLAHDCMFAIKEFFF